MCPSSPWRGHSQSKGHVCSGQHFPERSEKNAPGAAWLSTHCPRPLLRSGGACRVGRTRTTGKVSNDLREPKDVRSSHTADPEETQPRLDHLPPACIQCSCPICGRNRH